jgi:signal transduction histidine kinase
LLLMTGGISLLGLYAFKQPERPGKRYFFLMIYGWAAWTLSAALEIAVTNETARFVTVLLQMLCALLVATFTLFFSLEYAGRQNWLTRRKMALLLIPSFAIMTVAATNPLNHWFWSGMPFGSKVYEIRNTAAWIGIVYSQIICLINLGVLIDGLLRAPTFSTPIVLLMIGQVIPPMAFLLAEPGFWNLSPVQAALLASSLTIPIYFLTLFNFRLLRVSPIGRDVALKNMNYGLIVLDAENRLIDLNPAAHKLPGMPASIDIGQTADKALGVWWERIAGLVGSQPVSQELAVGIGSERQMFVIHSIPLLHSSGVRIGQTIVLNDVTPAWRTRQEQARRQWVQAALEEREQLAEELHDGLAQNLAFLNLQAQAAQVYLQTGQTEAAGDCLNRLVEVSRQMQGDTRELIGNLMIVSKPSEGFTTLLRQTLESAQKQTGVVTIFEVSPEAETLCNSEAIDPAVVVQMVRIFQEALTNVRKHACHANQVNVCLTTQSEELCLTVVDDGVGIDPAQLASAKAGHFGLEVMRQRASRIGARLEIQSKVGQGTQITVRVPIETAGSSG